jgi:hypothetical protein
MEKLETGAEEKPAKSKCLEILREYDREIAPGVSGFYSAANRFSKTIGIRISLREELFNTLRQDVENLLRMAEIDVTGKERKPHLWELGYMGSYAILSMGLSNPTESESEKAAIELEWVGRWVKRKAGYIVGI